jgi:hypothetical protein
MQTALTVWSLHWRRVVYCDIGSELYSLLLYDVEELEQNIKPILCYGSVTWTLTQTSEQMLNTFERENIAKNIWPNT